MNGVVRGSGEKIVLNYQQGASSDVLTAQIGSEAFQGKSVMRGGSAVVGNVFDFGGGGSSVLIGSSTSGDAVAVLLGDQGSTLSCQLQYADPGGLTNFGGVGVCQHSDGRVIDVIW